MEYDFEEDNERFCPLCKTFRPINHDAPVNTKEHGFYDYVCWRCFSTNGEDTYKASSAYLADLRNAQEKVDAARERSAMGGVLTKRLPEGRRV